MFFWGAGRGGSQLRRPGSHHIVDTLLFVCVSLRLHAVASPSPGIAVLSAIPLLQFYFDSLLHNVDLPVTIEKLRHFLGLFLSIASATQRWLPHFHRAGRWQGPRQ